MVSLHYYYEQQRIAMCLRAFFHGEYPLYNNSEFQPPALAFLKEKQGKKHQKLLFAVQEFSH